MPARDITLARSLKFVCALACELLQCEFVSAQVCPSDEQFVANSKRTCYCLFWKSAEILMNVRFNHSYHRCEVEIIINC